MNPLAEAVGDLGHKLSAGGERDAAVILYVLTGLLLEQNAGAIHRLSMLAVQIAQERRTAITAMDN